MTMRRTNNDNGGPAHALLREFAWKGRAILLVDLDAFFASVEQFDHPGWRGKPVIVGGSAERRGVVSTCSYEARAFGVRSAMPSSTARRLCPQAIWTEGHFDRYREMSGLVMSILEDETPHVQQVSIDEAFMDVTPTQVNIEHPVDIAERIQKRIGDLGITCSIGIGTSKSIAKIASDMDKPQGLTVVMPGCELNFIDQLPVKMLSGVGPSSEKKLAELGVRTLGQLYHAEDAMIEDALGKAGIVMLNRVRGLEDASVRADDEVKSVSNETSFARDLTERKDIEASIATMAAKVGRRLRMKGLKGRTLTLKVRYSNLGFHSAQCQLGAATDDELVMAEVLPALLDEVWQPGLGLRLVGVAVSGFDSDDEAMQPSLFEDGARMRSASASARRGLLDMTDKVKERFGEGSLRYGRELRLEGADTGSSAKNPADYK